MGFEFDALGWVTLVTCLGFTFVCNFGGSVAMLGDPRMAWYKSLRKPSISPRGRHVGIIFGSAWFLLSIAGGLAVYLAIVQNLPDNTLYQLGIVAYWLSAVLQLLWSFAFFGAHSVGAGLAILLLDLLVAVFATVCFFLFYTVPGFLMLALDAWLLYAALLNVWIYSLNSSSSAPKRVKAAQRI